MNASHLTPLQTLKDNASGSFDFDPNGGSWLERAIFGHRLAVVLLCVVITFALALPLRSLTLNASFENVIPTHHPFIVNYLDNESKLRGLGNTLDIAVAADHGTILTKSYIETLQKINDQLFLLPGVDRSYMLSLWTPAVRWQAVTSIGMDGGAVMPLNFTGTQADLAQLRHNIDDSGQIGTLVAPDFRSSIIHIPLYDIDHITHRPLDYGQLARTLDQLRLKYDAQGVTLHITGFAMIVGDLIEGMQQILGFFAISVAVTTAMVFWYTRCVRSTVLVVLCSMLAVYWQLGIVAALGYGLDPYSVLVPFLVFAIGMSHGSQKMNGVMQDIGRGSENLAAARMTFRRLFMAGFTALVCDAVGFGVLMTIQIEAIRELAIVASLGVAILIFTNLILLPVLLSYFGVSARAARRSLKAEEAANIGAARHPVWALLDLFTQRRYAAMALGVALIVGLAGLAAARHVQVGDINPGAPELRPDSQYNRDNAYIVSHYAAGSDQMVVMVRTPPGACADYDTLAGMDSLESQLDNLPGVISASSMADFQKEMSVQLNEGSFAWYDLIPNQPGLNETINLTPRSIVDQDCSMLLLSVFLKDHKASTLNSVVGMVQTFAAAQHQQGVTYLLAAGNAGIAAATNQVVSQANDIMLLEVYLAVTLLSLITFRSWRAVLAAILPLVLTSILAQALMVWLGIGVKVATLPVTALGVGIGVDYALYILSVTLSNMRKGMALSEAYYRALLFTGKVVMLTGCTLAAAVGTWAFSPIQFQADMGELLAFMFLWNMLGALVLLPALASFLLPRVTLLNYSRE
jgi:predicted RND superfamily exporter protein